MLDPQRRRVSRTRSGGRPGAHFSDRLRPFQRRVQRVIFLRSLPATGAVAALTMVIVLMRLQVSAMASALSMAAALVGAIAAAALIAIIRCPSPGATAALVDARFALLDRMVTALQFAEDEDPVAEHVVGDAAWHLGRLEPAMLDGRGPMRPVWALAAAVAAVVGVVIAMPAWIGSPWPPSDGAAAASAAATGSPLSDAARGRARSPRTPAAASGSPAPNSQPEAPQTERAHSALMAEPTRSDSRPEAGRGESTARTADANQTVATASANNGLPAAASRGETPASGGTGANARAAASAGSRSGRGGGATAAAATAVHRAGGVADGAVTAASDPSPSPVPAIDATRYRLAAARAEAAIAQHRVPASLRAYVRDYFLALRPPQNDASHR